MYLVILAPWCYMGSPKNQFDINNKIFQNDHIDIDIFQIGLLAINIFKISSSISIFCPYQYFQNKCRYFNNISKNVDLLTININISSKKHEKALKTDFSALAQKEVSDCATPCPAFRKKSKRKQIFAGLP